MKQASEILLADAPYSIESMVVHGYNLGAVKMILCSDHYDKNPIYLPENVYYIMPTDNLDYCEQLLRREHFCIIKDIIRNEY